MGGEVRRGEGDGRTDAPRRRKRDARKALCFCLWVVCACVPLGVVCLRVGREFMLACLVE